MANRGREGSEVLIRFVKAGHDGVNIESQRAGETT
jgi:hypothetical protein